MKAFLELSVKAMFLTVSEICNTFNVGNLSKKSISTSVMPDASVNVSVRLDAPGGREIARLEAVNGEVTVPLNGGITGTHAVYFVFETAEGKAEMDRFTFDD